MVTLPQISFIVNTGYKLWNTYYVLLNCLDRIDIFVRWVGIGYESVKHKWFY